MTIPSHPPEKPAIDDRTAEGCRAAAICSPRPSAEGFWWRHWRGQWAIGKAKIILWGDDDDPEDKGERILAWSNGGAWFRCDVINRKLDDGSRWWLATPPTVKEENDPDQIRRG